MRLSFAALASTKLPSTDRCLPSPIPLPHTGARSVQELLEEVRLLKSPMSVLGECRVMWDLLIETQTREPAPGQVHAQLFHQLALAGNAVPITQKAWQAFL